MERVIRAVVGAGMAMAGTSTSDGPLLTDEDTARVAEEGGIGPSDIADGRLRHWLRSTLRTYRMMASLYADLPPQASSQSRVYADLERRVADVRRVLDAHPWLAGDMVRHETRRLGMRARPAVDDDRISRIGMAATSRVRRDLRALALLERRARAARLAIEESLRGHRPRPVGHARREVDDLTWAILAFWHRVLRRPLLNRAGGVAIGSESRPSRLVRFACAVYRLAEGESWTDASTRFESARSRLKLVLVASVMDGSRPAASSTPAHAEPSSSSGPASWRERFMRQLVRLGTDPDSAREWAMEREPVDAALDPEQAAEAEWRRLMAHIDTG